MLRGLARGHHGFIGRSILKGLQQGLHLAEAAQLAEARAGVAQCAGDLVQRHGSVLPGPHVARVVRDRAVEVLDRVGRAQRAVQRAADVQLLNGQRFLQALLQADRGAWVLGLQRRSAHNGWPEAGSSAAAPDISFRRLHPRRKLGTPRFANATSGGSGDDYTHLAQDARRLRRRCVLSARAGRVSGASRCRERHGGDGAASGHAGRRRCAEGRRQRGRCRRRGRLRAGGGVSGGGQPRRRRLHDDPARRWSQGVPRLPREGAAGRQARHVPRPRRQRRQGPEHRRAPRGRRAGHGVGTRTRAREVRHDEARRTDRRRRSATPRPASCSTRATSICS